METEEYFFTRVCIHLKKEINAKIFSNFCQTDGFISPGRIYFKGLCWSEHKACTEEKAQTSVWCCHQLSLFPGKPNVSWCLSQSRVCWNYKIERQPQFSLKEKQIRGINIWFHDSRELKDLKAKQRKPKYVIGISNMFVFKSLLYFKGSFWALWGNDSALVHTQPTYCWQHMQPKADRAYRGQ